MNVQQFNWRSLSYLSHARVYGSVLGLNVSILMVVLNTYPAAAQFVKKITASDATPGDFLGGDTEIGGAHSLDLFGEMAIVGTFRDNSAYIFQRDEGGLNNWGEAARLPTGGQCGDVAVFDDVAVTGGGSAKLFTRDENGVWDAGMRLGVGGFSGLGLSGETTVVGNSLADGYTGAAFAFNRDEGGISNWGQVARLTASDGSPDDFFGAALAISENTLIIGAPLDDDDGRYSGSAYVFERNEGGPNNWGEVTKLTASDAKAGDWLGISVDLYGDTAIVGATQWNVGNGAAYILEREEDKGDNWAEVAKLTASDGAADDGFGESVAIFGDLAVVGAVRDKFHKGIAADSGSVYVFSRNEGGPNNWGEILTLTAPDRQPNDHFGKGVDVFEDTIIVTAPGHNDNAGAAYIFEVPQPGQTLMPGDADQSHGFNQLDLVQVLIAGKYMTGQLATWGEGDWNGAPGGSPGNPPAGDEIFDQLDILAALSTGMYLQGACCESGEFAALSPVPEPSTVILLALGIAGVTLLTRRGQI